MARPRVLLLITLAETGGAQQYVASLLPALAREYDVLVAAHGDGFLGDASRSAGVRYLSLRHVRRPLHPLRDLLGLVELYRLIRRERPAVVHANSSKAGILGRLAAVAARVPVRLFTVHGWAFKAHQGLAARLYLYADRAMSPLTTTTICVAHGEVEAGIRARTCRPDRTVMIHNGVELDRPQRAPGPPRTPVTLLSVGRFRPPKDFTTLVHAMAALEPGTARLEIAGDGPDRQALEQEIANPRPRRDGRAARHAPRRRPAARRRRHLRPVERLRGTPDVRARGDGGRPPGDRDSGRRHPRARHRRTRPARSCRRATARPSPPRSQAIAGDPQLRDRLGAAARRRAETEFSLETCRRRHLDLYRDLLRKRT